MWLKLWKQLRLARKHNWLIASLAILVVIIMISTPVWAVVKQQAAPIRQWLGVLTQDITITAIPITVGAPESFTVTYISDLEVKITWTKPEDAVNTMIRAAVGRYPKDREVGYLVYYGDGESTSDTGVNLNETTIPVYYRAWSENESEEWSPIWAEGSIEGVSVAELASVMTQIFSILAIFVQFLPLVFFCVLAFWKNNPVLFMLAAGAALFNGIYWYDKYDSPIGLSIGLILIAFSVYCLGMAFRYIFWRSE